MDDQYLRYAITQDSTKKATFVPTLSEYHSDDNHHDPFAKRVILERHLICRWQFADHWYHGTGQHLEDWFGHG